MHILIITPGFPKNQDDTGCIPAMQDFLKEFSMKFPDFIFSVIALHYPFKTDQYKWYGMNVYSCGGRGKRKPLRLFTWLLAIIYIIKINRKSKIDLVHSFWLNEPAMLGGLAAKFLNVKHITTIMGQDAKDNNKYLRKLNLNNIFKIAVSEYQAGVFKQSCKLEPDKIIPWGVNSLLVEDNPRQLDILGVGSLIPVKNFTLFIKVIKALREEFPGIKSVLIGGGEQFKELNTLITEENLQKNILLTGNLNRETVLKYMSKSKILLHTSVYESFGLVIAEALASGCYIVCKPIGCAKQSDKIFIANEVNEFAGIIRNLLINKKEFKPCNLFPLDQTVNSYAGVYFNLIKGAN